MANPTRSTPFGGHVVTIVERGHTARLAADMKVGKYDGDHFLYNTLILLAAELDSVFDGFLGTCI